MRRLQARCIVRMRVISRKGLPNPAVYRSQPSYWKTRSDSRNQAKTQLNRLLGNTCYWQIERARCSGQLSNRVVSRGRSASLADTRAEVPALYARSRAANRQRATL